MILIKEALWVGWDWDGWMVIIGRRKSKSTFGDNACIRGWAGGAEGSYHGGGWKDIWYLLDIFCRMCEYSLKACMQRRGGKLSRRGLACYR